MVIACAEWLALHLQMREKSEPAIVAFAVGGAEGLCLRSTVGQMLSSAELIRLLLMRHQIGQNGLFANDVELTFTTSS